MTLLTSATGQRANFKRLGSAGTSSYSAFQASFAGKVSAADEEEPVGIITIEDVIEEVWGGRGRYGRGRHDIAMTSATSFPVVYLMIHVMSFT